jgi:hypothetical protein
MTYLAFPDGTFHVLCRLAGFGQDSLCFLVDIALEETSNFNRANHFGADSKELIWATHLLPKRFGRDLSN